jgi:endonuclease YncB( thermonuclease family)
MRRPAVVDPGHSIGDELVSALDPSFRYAGDVVRVIDGDTIVIDVDLGFGIWLRSQSFRLLGVNAREHSAPGGKEARMNLASMLPVGTRLTVTSVKADKYGGRFDAMLTLPDGRDVARELIAGGWAAAWNGQGVKPVPAWPRASS